MIMKSSSDDSEQRKTTKIFAENGLHNLNLNSSVPEHYPSKVNMDQKWRVAIVLLCVHNKLYAPISRMSCTDFVYNTKAY